MKRRTWLACFTFCVFAIFTMISCSSSSDDPVAGDDGTTTYFAPDEDISNGVNELPKISLTDSGEKYFMDSPVENLRYVFDGSGEMKEGFTDAVGRYGCGPGDVHFYVGEVFLGTIPCDFSVGIVTPLDLVENNQGMSDIRVQNIAAFLQTLDQDGNVANGISIDKEIATNFQVEEQPDFSSLGVVREIIEDIRQQTGEDYSNQVVEREDAIRHLDNFLTIIDAKLTESIEMVKSSDIYLNDEKFRETLDYLIAEDKIHLIPGLNSNKVPNPASGRCLWNRTPADSGIIIDDYESTTKLRESLLFGFFTDHEVDWDDRKILIAGTIIHETTHFMDYTRVANGEIEEITGEQLEINGHANQYAFLDKNDIFTSRGYEKALKYIAAYREAQNVQGEDGVTDQNLLRELDEAWDIRGYEESDLCPIVTTDFFRFVPFVEVSCEKIPVHSLSIETAGTGSGQIQIRKCDENGNCQVYDTQEFEDPMRIGENVEFILSALPDAGSTFSTWGGITCYGSDDCALRLTDNAEVIARFDLEAPPLSPLDVSANAGNREIEISWTPVENVDTYNVYLNDVLGASPQNYVFSSSGLANPFFVRAVAFPGIQNGVTYYVVVTAENSFGESQPSAEVAVTPAEAIHGSISGNVLDAANQTPLQNVTVMVYEGGEYVTETQTLGDGNYALEVEAGLDYSMNISKPGYLPATYANVQVLENNTTFLETILQIDERFSGIGTMKGFIYNAFDGTPVSEATIRFRRGINVQDGSVVATVTTESDGGYFVSELEAGNYTGEISATGFSAGYFRATCLGGTNNTGQDGTITPLLGEGETRFVLTWGQTPQDLDSHLTGPLPDGSQFHVFYSDKSARFEDVLYADLDLDDTSSFGPETTTIYRQLDGTYRFLVHDYTNRSDGEIVALSNSQAKVEVYQGSTLVATFNVPSNRGGTVWTVCEVNGTTITPINTMDYESSASNVRSGRAADTDLELFRNLPSK